MKKFFVVISTALIMIFVPCIGVAAPRVPETIRQPPPDETQAQAQIAPSAMEAETASSETELVWIVEWILPYDSILYCVLSERVAGRSGGRTERSRYTAKIC